MLVSAIEGHRLWAPYYDSDCNPVLALESRIVRHLLSPVWPQCFIDVACGTGRWMTYFAQRGVQTFGIDVCPGMLAEAERKLTAKGRSVIADATRLPFATSIADTVLCSFAIAYFPDLAAAIAEMAGIAKPGARIVISDLHPEGVAAGWTRSFRVGSDVYEMQHNGPSIEEIRHAAQCAGLRLQMQIHACFDEPERVLFRARGKEQVFLQLARTPAVWVATWIKL